MKASVKNLNKNTPAKLRKLGNALFAFSAVICAGSAISDYPNLAIAALIVGAIGKFITELFTDEQV